MTLDYHNPMPNPARSLKRRSRVKYVLMHAYWIFLAAGFVGGVGYVFALSGMKLLGVYGSLLAYVLLVGLASSRMRKERRKLDIVLSYIDRAVSLNLPLAPMLGTALKSERAPVARALRDLQTYLQDGMPVGQAVGAALPTCPQRVTALLDAADRNGTLPRVLERLLREERRVHDIGVASMSMFRAYNLIVVLALGSLITLMQIFIFPRFYAVMRDFNIPPPRGLQVLTGLQYGEPIAIAMIAGLIAIALATRAVRQLFVPGLPRGPFSHWIDRIRWRLPLLHSIDRDHGLADVCSVVADGLTNGRTATSAIALAAGDHLNRVLWHKVHYWASDVSHGLSLTQSARNAQLPPLLVAMLGTGQGQDQPASLRFLATYYADRHLRLLTYFRAAFGPAMTLLLGSLVTFVALAMFTSMQRMTEAADYFRVQL